MNFYVVSPDASGWTVSFNGAPHGSHFQCHVDALSAARQAALTRWNMFGLASRVTIRGEGSEVIDDVAYGDCRKTPPAECT